MCLLDVVEIDMCLESDICDQVCIHRNGSLTCECQEGYRMEPLTGECKATGELKRAAENISSCLCFIYRV